MLIFLSLRRTKNLSSFELYFNLSTGYSYNKLLALRRFWNIKYQTGFSQMGKFVCSSLWEYGTVPVLKLCNTTWVGRTGGRKAEVVSLWCGRWLQSTSVSQTLEQPLFSLSCFVLHNDHSPQWALGAITFCFASVTNFACFDDCVDLVGSIWWFSFKRLKL